jgi:hypothetical protein
MWDRLPACRAELDVFHAAGLVPIVLLCRCYVLIGLKFGFTGCKATPHGMRKARQAGSLSHFLMAS